MELALLPLVRALVQSLGVLVPVPHFQLPQNAILRTEDACMPFHESSQMKKGK